MKKILILFIVLFVSFALKNTVSAQDTREEIIGENFIKGFTEFADLRGGVRGNYSGLRNSYDNGKKDLMRLSAGYVGINVSYYLDLNDYYSSYHTDNPITEEGADGWITVWIDGKVGASVDYNPSPLGAGLAQVDFDTDDKGNEDAKRPWNVNILSGGMPFLQLKSFEIDLRNKTGELFNVETNPVTEIGVDFLSIEGNLVSFEIQKEVLDKIIGSALIKDSDSFVFNSTTASSALNNLLSNFIRIDENWKVTYSDTFLDIVNSDNYRNITTSDNALEPAKIDGVINHARGGYDVNDDYIPDNYYSLIPTFLGLPIANIDPSNSFELSFSNLGTEVTDFLIKAESYPEGWIVAPEDDDGMRGTYDDKFKKLDVYPSKDKFIKTQWGVFAGESVISGIGDLKGEIKFGLYKSGLTNTLLDTISINVERITEETNFRPSLSFTNLESDLSITKGETQEIRWNDEDVDDNASIAIAIDPDLNSTPWEGESNHKWIEVGISEDNSTDLSVLNSDEYDLGEYKIWGLIYDGVNDPVYTAATGSITIEPNFDDISLSNGSVSPSRGNVGDTFDFKVNYKSPYDIEPNSVSLNLDGTVYSMTTNSSSYSGGVDYKNSKSNLSQGEHSYYFTAEVNGEKLRYPQSGSQKLNVSQSAEDWDLAVSESSTISPLQPKEGSSISINASIDNLGVYNYKEVKVKARLVGPSGSTIDSNKSTLGNLEANKQEDVNLSLEMPNSSSEGTYQVIITAYGANGLDENNENNVISRSFYIGELLGTDEYMAVHQSEELYQVGDSFSINNKSVEVESISSEGVRFSHNGEQKLTQNLAIYEDSDIAVYVTTFSTSYTSEYESVYLYRLASTTNGPKFSSTNINLYKGERVKTVVSPPSGHQFEDLENDKDIFSEDNEYDFESWVKDANELADGKEEIVWKVGDEVNKGRYQVYYMIEYVDNPPSFTNLYLNVIEPAPSIESLSRNNISADDIITINGSNFGGNTGKVKFSDLEGNINSWSDSKISVKVPEGVENGLLTVTNGSGTSNGVSYEVISSTGDPEVQQSIPDQFIQAGDTTKVADLTNTFWDPNGDDLKFNVDIGYEKLSFIGDSLSKGKLILTPEKDSYGVHNVSIDATDADNVSVSETFSVDINPILRPSFTVDVDSGKVPLTVNFTDQSEPQAVISSWEWDFDNDGTIDSNEQSPQSYTYSEAGVYTPKLVVGTGQKTKAYYGFNLIEVTSEADTSSTDITPPAVPTNLLAQIQDSTSGHIALNWAPNDEPDLSYYKLYRDTLSTELTFLNRIDIPETSYDDTVQNGQTYHYRISAVDTAGNESDISNIASIIITNPTLAVVAPLSGAFWRIGTEQLIEWSSENLGGFVDIVLLNSDGKVTDIATGTANDGNEPWTLGSDLSAGTDYRVGITASSDPAIADTSDKFTIYSNDSTYSVSGKVIDNSDNPLENVELSLSGDDDQETKSGSEGKFTFDDISDGSYTITPHLEGYSFSPESKETTISGSSVTGIEFVGTKSSDLTANFESDTTSGQKPLSVNFSDKSTPENDITEWRWDFNNDGVIDSNQENPPHTYQDAGTYSVTLTVSDGQSEASVTKKNFITVLEDGESGSGTLNLHEISTVTKGQKKWLTVYTDPKQEGIPVNFEVKDQTIGSIELVNNGVTNSSGYANAEFVASSTGTTSVTVTSDGFTSDTEDVKVVDSSTGGPVTFVPQFESGTPSSSIYRLEFHYSEFSWLNDKYKLTTDNGIFTQSSSSTLSDEFSNQDKLFVDLKIRNEQKTNITLEFNGESFQFSFNPILINNETIKPFKEISGRDIHGIDWSSDGTDFVYSVRQDIVRVDAKNWEELESKEINDIDGFEISNSGDKLAYGADDQINILSYPGLNHLKSSSTFNFGNGIEVSWSHDDSKIGVARRNADDIHSIFSSSLSLIKDLPIYGNVTDIDFNPQKDEYAFAVESVNEARVYNSDTWDEIKSIDVSSDDEGSSVSYSPDGRFLAASERNSVISIYDGADNFNKVKTITDEFDKVLRIRWNPIASKNALAALSFDNIYIYDTGNANRISKSINLPSNSYVMRWSPDGEVLAVINGDENIQLYAPFDQVGPSITLVDEKESFETTNDKIVISGFVKDANTVSSANVKVNDGELKKLALDNDGRFEEELQLIEGSNEIKVLAEDRFLNKTAKSFTVNKISSNVITGVVHDTTDNPLSGVTISLSGNSSQGVKTKQDGKFQFSVQSGFDYTLVPAKDLYQFKPEKVELTDLQKDTSLTFTAIPKSYSISGTITDTFDNPLEDVKLQIKGDTTLSGETNSLGRFKFEGLKPNIDLQINATSDEYTFSPTTKKISGLNRNWIADFVAENLPPKVPTGLAVIIEDTLEGALNISWDSNTESDLSHYVLYRDTLLNKTSPLDTLEASITNFSDTVDVGKSYYYHISALDTVGNESDISTPVEVEILDGIDQDSPTKPRLIEVKNDTNGIKLYWSRIEANDLSHVIIYRGLSDEPTDSLTSIKSDTTYKDTDFTIGQTYYYRLVAEDTAGNKSGYSNQVSITAKDLVPPGIPKNLSVTSTDSQDPIVELNWEPNSEKDLTGYNIYRSEFSFTDSTNASRINSAVVTDSKYVDSEVSNDKNYFYRIAAIDTSGNQSDLSGEQKVSLSDQMRTIAMSFSEGWNLTGLPVKKETTYYKDLFPNVLSVPFSFDGSYQQEENLKYGEGYWVKINSDSTFSMVGAKLDSMEISLTEGWNLISGISNAVSVENIKDPQQLVSGTLFGFEGAYFRADSIKPGMGYWVNASSSGSIKLIATNEEDPIMAKTTRVNNSEADQKSNESNLHKITFELENGISSEYYFGRNASEDLDSPRYQMPPMAPRGSFDARFIDTGSRVTVTDTPILSIRLPKNPNITVKLNLKGESNGKSFDYQLLSGEEVITESKISDGQQFRIINPGVNRIKLSPEGKLASLDTPDTFELSSNYPNPFNPTTVIPYQVPKTVSVKIELYNIIGRKVLTLLNEKQTPGQYEVTLDGSRLSSGIYFYRIQAGKFVETKKLLLIK